MVRTSGFHPDNRGSIPLGDVQRLVLRVFLRISLFLLYGVRVDLAGRLSQEVILFLRNEIKNANGNEIFATGCIDSTSCVKTITVHARGHDTAVPVVPLELSEVSVLIHNHPSGNLKPSQADLAIASKAAQNAQGFYIINNDVTDVYVVVEPVKERIIQQLNAQELSLYISSGGPLETQSEYFEQRDSQIELLKSITNSFNNKTIGIFEAGTGVGKSFAYLIPSIFWAINNKERVVISTGTINLQQQLYEKDIPLAQKITGKEVKTVLLKGRQNFICKRRLNDAQHEKDLFTEESDELELIAKWAHKSITGNKSDLSFLPSENVWQRINSESDACMGMRCIFHESCFVMQLRKEAADADILIVNHHLLFADIETRLAGLGYDETGVLPPFRRLVFDEAHSIESAATSFFSETITRYKFIKQLNLLYRSRRGSSAGLIFTIEPLSSEGNSLGEIVAGIEEIRNSIDDLETKTLEMLGYDSTFRLSDATVCRAVDVLSSMRSLHKKIAEFCGIIRKIIEGISEEDRDMPAVWETKQVLRRIEGTGSLCKNFNEWDERRDTVFWIEKKRTALSAHKTNSSGGKTMYPVFVQTPLSIAHTMNSGVFEPLSSVVCTSATLRTSNSFNFWLKRSGAGLVDEDRLYCADFPSPFRYNTNVMLVVPTDIPLPDSSSFQQIIEESIVKYIKSSSGRALILFTSYESLRSACDYARNELKSDGITVLKQGEDDRFRLLEKFKEDTTSVLFATSSFWEGVDVPGESLSHVIIVKLPFCVPNDPVFSARCEALERAGGNSFMELSVPDAIISFRQGFGRLLRRGTDRGVVTVLDKRILVKMYGRQFLESVPQTKTCFEPMQETYARIERFLS